MRKIIYILFTIIGIAAAGAQGLTISLLLPLKDAKGAVDQRFVEFYRGAVLAAEQLRDMGVSMNVEVFDTPRSEWGVDEIVHSPEFQRSNVVIGPVYEEGLAQVIEWGEQNGAMVVSPLSSFEQFSSSAFFQMPPLPARRYDKLMEKLMQPDVNVVYVSTARADRDMDAALGSQFVNAPTITYSNATRGASFEAQIDRKARENVFVVSCTDPHMVDGILSKISSAQTSLVSRGVIQSRVRVVGSPEWAWFPSTMIDRELYFKVGVCWVSNYHVDRTNERVRQFDGRYIAAFGELPPSAPAVRPGAREVRIRPYAYRGYDAVMLFGRYLTQDSILSSNEEILQESGSNLLCVNYVFQRSGGFGRGRSSAYDGSWCNENWPLVCYRPDYTIVVE